VPPGSPSTHPKSSCRDALLDAAEEVVLRAGIGSLTLDAVASEARVSKGGLLYHFPSKDALILAMVQRTCDNWKSEYVEAIGSEPKGPGRVARALLRMCLGSTESCSAACRRSGVVLVAAIVNNPALAEPLRRTHDDLRSRLKEDPPSAAAGEAVVLAMNGLWFEQVFGLGEMKSARLKALHAVLTSLIDAAPAGKRGRSAPRGRSAATKTARRNTGAARGRRGSTS
jgi:AcrR family transcriptional regulator